MGKLKVIPMSSLAARTSLLAMYNGSSPLNIILVHQYNDALSSLARMDLCIADIKL